MKLQIDNENRMRRGVLWGCVGCVVLLLDFVGFWIGFQGWMNFDTQVQWAQVQEGVYTQWHPFVHTFLMMKAPSLLWNDYRVTVLWQMLLFSLSFGYLAYSLCKVGVGRPWLLIGLLATLFHPQTLFFLMTPLKDSAFAIAVMVSTAALTMVAVEGVEALKRKDVCLPLVCGLALSSLFRHNGIFFSVPTIGLLGLFCVKRHLAWFAKFVLLFLVVFAGLKWGLPKLYHVRPASAYPEKYTFIESCGLPLSMMGAVYMKHPDEIPASARALLESIAPREIWFGKNNWSFNSVKHHGAARLNDERISGYRFSGWKDFARDFVATVKVDPGCALSECLRLTGQVWNPAGHPSHQFWFPLHKVGFSNETIRWLLPVVSVLSIPLVGVVGLTVWLGLVACAWALMRRAWPVVLLTVPILCYDLGTMFFLSGYAVYRFFFCNVLVVVPMLVIVAPCRKKVLLARA